MKGNNNLIVTNSLTLKIQLFIQSNFVLTKCHFSSLNRVGERINKYPKTKITFTNPF